MTYPAKDVLRRFDELTKRSQRAIEPDLEQYVTACALARGPDKLRAAYWERRAYGMERRLRERMGLADPMLENRIARTTR